MITPTSPFHIIALALIGLDVALWRRDARRGVMAAFPCMAVATAALGVGWAMAVVIP